MRRCTGATIAAIDATLQLERQPLPGRSSSSFLQQEVIEFTVGPPAGADDTRPHFPPPNPIANCQPPTDLHAAAPLLAQRLVVLSLGLDRPDGRQVHQPTPANQLFFNQWREAVFDHNELLYRPPMWRRAHEPPNTAKRRRLAEASLRVHSPPGWGCSLCRNRSALDRQMSPCLRCA